MDKYTFYNHEIANRGRLMDVMMNFMICVDSLSKSLSEEDSKSLIDESSKLMARLDEISKVIWPIS